MNGKKMKEHPLVSAAYPNCVQNRGIVNSRAMAPGSTIALRP